MTNDDDPLLAALDHFTNAVASLQHRATITADQALAEAIADWLIRDNRPLPVDLVRPGRRARTAARPARPRGTAAALTEALSGWTAALSAEHNASQLFQPPADAHWSNADRPDSG